MTWDATYEPKQYIAFGPGYSGTYNYFKEAMKVVKNHGVGAVYKLVEESITPDPEDEE